MDLDNTIYPVSSIGDKLFKTLFDLISESGEFAGDFNQIKAEIMRRPFQFVAEDFSFSKKLKSDCLNLFLELTYDESMEPYDDYKYVRKIQCRKFLVTTGFAVLQHSKIFHLNIKDDFEGIFIIDPVHSDLTKKAIFRKILTDNGLKREEVLVVGDDLNNEIKAAKDLGIDAILYDHESAHAGLEKQKTISNFKDLQLAIGY